MPPISPLAQRLSENVGLPRGLLNNFWGKMLHFFQFCPDQDHGDPDWLDSILAEIIDAAHGGQLSTEWAKATLPTHLEYSLAWRSVHEYVSACQEQQMSPGQILEQLYIRARVEMLCAEKKYLLF